MNGGSDDAPHLHQGSRRTDARTGSLPDIGGHGVRSVLVGLARLTPQAAAATATPTAPGGMASNARARVVAAPTVTRGRRSRPVRALCMLVRLGASHPEGDMHPVTRRSGRCDTSGRRCSVGPIRPRMWMSLFSYELTFNGRLAEAIERCRDDVGPPQSSNHRLDGQAELTRSEGEPPGRWRSKPVISARSTQRCRIRAARDGWPRRSHRAESVESPLGAGGGGVVRQLDGTTPAPV
jgi:hypothetical protein